MYWKETPVRGVEEAQLPQFTIIGYETNDRKEKLATGIYQRLSLSFKLQRNIGYFVFQVNKHSFFWVNDTKNSCSKIFENFMIFNFLIINLNVRQDFKIKNVYNFCLVKEICLKI